MTEIKRYIGTIHLNEEGEGVIDLAPEELEMKPAPSKA